VVVPANAGTHTPRPAKWAHGETVCFNGDRVRKQSVRHRASLMDHAVWVPAFAGTTLSKPPYSQLSAPPF
jgi:hypothetical protein